MYVDIQLICCQTGNRQQINSVPGHSNLFAGYFNTIKRFVEYFMDIQADEEIDDSTVCNYVATDDKTRREWTRVLDCYDAVEDPGSVLYNTDDIDLLGSLCEECE